jgi:hypothetical protein
MKQHTIEAQFRDGTLLESIERGAPESVVFLELCVELHNSGRIDLVALVGQGAHERLSRHNFFPVMHFYCKAIPRLEGVPVERMMMCVARLVQTGGSDLAANLPNNALLKWCGAHPSRADQIIERAQRGDQLAIDHLTFALQAKGDLQLARDMVTGYADQRRIAGLTALSRMAHREAADRALTVTTVAPLVEGDADDAARAHVLSTVVQVHESGGVQLPPEALAIVERALASVGDLTLHGAAHALLHTKACLETELVELLLATLLGVNPKNKGTIDLIDGALHDLPRKGFGEQAIRFVTQLLSRTDAALQLEQLGDFTAGLTKGDPTTFSGVVVKWLLSGNRQLCEGVAELARKRHVEDAPLSIAFGTFGLSDTQTYFVCRKAIGYLFLQPVIAGSVLVSALRTANGDLCSMIKELLFDPLLINYGGLLRDYLASLDGLDAARAHVDEVLARADAYISGLSGAGTIKELHPSEHRRQLERIRMMDFNREVNKKAQRQSIFWDIVHRSVLLHGHHSVTLVEGADGETRPVEMTLQSIEHSMEWPRMETVDPVGLDMMLRVFRAEQFAS